MKTIIPSSKALCAGLILTYTQSTWAQSDILAKYGTQVQVFGNMMRNDITFVDGMKVNIYAPTNRMLTVEQNESPLPATFVTGTTGENFRLALGYSYKFTTDNQADDVIAQIAIPYTPAVLTNRSLSAGNTYVGQLTNDKKSWSVISQDRTVETAEFRTQMSQMTSLAGEFILLVRNTMDEGNVFLEYGTGDQFSANFTGGPGLQDVEYMDGLGFAVQTNQPMRMNVVLRYPIVPSEIPSGMMSLNAYAWVINTTVNANIPQGGAGTGVPGGNSTGNGGNRTIPAVITGGIPQPAGTIEPAIASSPFVYAQPYGNRRIRRAPLANAHFGNSANSGGYGGFGNAMGSVGQVGRQAAEDGLENSESSSSSPYDDGVGIGQAQGAQLPTSQLMPPNPQETTQVPVVSATSETMSEGRSSMEIMSMKNTSTSSATSVAIPSIKSSLVPSSTTPIVPLSASTTPTAAAATNIGSARIQFPVNIQMLQQRLVPSENGNTANPFADLDLNSITFMIGRRDAGSKAAFTPLGMNSNANLTASPSVFGSANTSPLGPGVAVGNSTASVLATPTTAQSSVTANAPKSTASSAASQGFTISNGRIVMDTIGALDGEYVILVPITQGIGGAAPATQSAAAAAVTGTTAGVKANADSSSSAPSLSSMRSLLSSFVGFTAILGSVLFVL